MRLSLLFSSLLFSLLFLACENEYISPVDAGSSSGNAVDLTNLPPISPNQVELGVKDGIPFYEDAKAFSQALHALTRISSNEYLTWAADRNLTTAYHVFLEKVEQAEADGYQFKKSDLDYLIPLQEGGAIQNPFNIYARLISPQGYVYVGSDIQYFSGTKHVLVDDGDLNDIQAEKDRTETSESDGVYVWHRDLTPLLEYHSLDSSAKVQITQFACPAVLGRSDQFGFVTTWWQNPLLNGALTRQDEQRVDCNRSGCRQGTWGVFGTTIDIVQVAPLSYQYLGGLNYVFDNRRRDGLIWKRTYPNVLISGRLIDGGDQTIFTNNTQEIPQGNPAGGIIRVLNTQTIAPPAEFVFTAQENVLISPAFVATVPFQFANGSLNTVFGFIRVEDGSTSHKWTNRGNNPIGDPIGTEFRCQ